jgi:hypothetical protein
MENQRPLNLVFPNKNLVDIDIATSLIPDEDIIAKENQ